MSKKTLFMISMIGAIISIVLLFSRELSLCPESSYMTCTNLLENGAEVLFIFVPVTIFSVVTYHMRSDLYGRWLRFARFWIPLALALPLLTPQYSDDWMYPIEKGTVAFVMSAIFVVVSIGIIGYQLLKRK